MANPHDMTIQRAKGGFVVTHADGSQHVVPDMPSLKKHAEQHLDPQNKSRMTIEPDPAAAPRYQLPTEKTRQQKMTETQKA